jgi:hypothetical protein
MSNEILSRQFVESDVINLCRVDTFFLILAYDMRLRFAQIRLKFSTSDLSIFQLSLIFLVSSTFLS